MGEPLRKCTICGVVAHNNEELKLFVSSNRHKLGYRKQCKKCKSAEGKKWYLKNKDKQENYNMVRRYGITVADYDDMLIAQNGCCAICKTTKTSNRKVRFDIDHDHNTGLVRGLLCWNCNNGLGQFRDNIDNIKSAARYLEERITHVNEF